MEKHNRMSATKKNNKIIFMALDANFFFERGLRHLDRNNHSKALKYFKRTVDIEPNNPVHYCNIAGLLAEMGHYKESNEFLLYVVEKLDSSFTECYYYLANNYAHMEDLESSYKYIHRYLDVAPHGEFAEEAKEMLSYISVEMNDLDDDEDSEQQKLFLTHYKAKSLLEDGKFYEAIKKLKQLTEEHPDFLAARNNLALAYFYLGNFNKAIEQSKIVIERDNSNIHALCNLAVFYQHLNEKEQLDYLLDFLRKVVPIEKEHRYKLATTFAIMSQHELAFKHLSQLVSQETVLDPVLIHYTAVAAFNTGRYSFARKKWEQILKLDDGSQIARYYLDLTPNFENNIFSLPVYCYQYQLPFEEQINLLQIRSKHYHDSFISASFIWGLENGNERIKEKILLGLSLYKNKEAEKILREFLLSDNHTYLLRKKAVAILEQLNAKSPYNIKIAEKIIEVERKTPDIDLWKDKWLQVLELIEKNMNTRYNIIELYDAKTLWYDFISKTYPNIPQVRKIEGWVAAIEYIVIRMYRKSASIDKVAERYNVSKQTLINNINKFDEVLGVNKKISNKNPLENINIF